MREGRRKEKGVKDHLPGSGEGKGEEASYLDEHNAHKPEWSTDLVRSWRGWEQRRLSQGFGGSFLKPTGKTLDAKAYNMCSQP